LLIVGDGVAMLPKVGCGVILLIVGDGVAMLPNVGCGVILLIVGDGVAMLPKVVVVIVGCGVITTGSRGASKMNFSPAP
jgi:hypothetical protein